METYSVREFLLTVRKQSFLQALPGCRDYVNDPLMAASAPAKPAKAMVNLIIQFRYLANKMNRKQYSKSKADIQ